MNTFEAIFMTALLGVIYAAVPRASVTCHTSGDCSAPTSCCRDSNGHALVQGDGGFGGGFGPIDIGTHTTGTCSSDLGKEHDVCDSSCQCGTGLECYRPMSGVCCPPMRCYNATWVHQQKQYWSTCLSNPKCFLPQRQ